MGVIGTRQRLGHQGPATVSGLGQRKKGQETAPCAVSLAEIPQGPKKYQKADDG